MSDPKPTDADGCKHGHHYCTQCADEAALRRLRDALEAAEAERDRLRAWVTEAERDALRAELAALRELVADAAPLTWVANDDMDAAQAWEKRAHEMLRASMPEGAGEP